MDPQATTDMETSTGAMTLNMDIWKGAGFDRSPSRILILGESTYGDDPPLAVYVRRWVAGKQPDYLFSRLFRVCCGQPASSATLEARGGFWDSVAFYNFVPDSVGAKRSDRPTASNYKKGEDLLPTVLAALQPAGVWILGIDNALYSKPIITERNIVCRVSQRPCGYGVKTSELEEEWSKLKLLADNSQR